MHLSDKQTEIINHIQETVKPKEAKFLVFHEDKGYTVTYQIEEALRMNKPIIVITQYNAVSFSPVTEETKVEIKKRIEMILSLERDEPRSECKKGNEKDDLMDEYKPDPLSDDDIDRVLTEFGKGEFVDGMDPFTPIFEHPTYIADLMTITANDLTYNLDEIKRMLSFLHRMQPVYAEFYKGKRVTDMEQIKFVAEQLLGHIGRKGVELTLFNEALNEKILFPIEVVEGMSNVILSELLLQQISIS